MDWVEHVTVKIVGKHIVSFDCILIRTPVIVLDCLDEQVKLCFQFYGLNFAVLVFQLHHFFKLVLLFVLLTTHLRRYHF